MLNIGWLFQSVLLILPSLSSAQTAMPASLAGSQVAQVISYPPERNVSKIDVSSTILTMTEIAGLYSAAVHAHDTAFAWDFSWEKPWLGAGSKLYEGTFSIMLWGGFVRAEGMTLRGLEFTICHEFGHFLGGEPRQTFPFETESWSSVEGQADWWAASVCLPTLYRLRGLKTSAARDRILKAGLDFARFAQSQYEKDSPSVSLDKAAPERPASTLVLSYPSLQCRLDTIRLGADCIVSDEDASGQCERPRCWFVPQSVTMD